MILCDTNIFIEAFKNNPSAIETLRRIGFQNISLSAVTLMELYFGAFNKRELAKIKSRMKHLEMLLLDMIRAAACRKKYLPMLPIWPAGKSGRPPYSR